jgi:hypothetical protein
MRHIGHARCPGTMLRGVRAGIAVKPPSSVPGEIHFAELSANWISQSGYFHENRKEIRLITK